MANGLMSASSDSRTSALIAALAVRASTVVEPGPGVIPLIDGTRVFINTPNRMP